MTQKEMFHNIWVSSKVKECALCGEWLPHPARSFYFSHILSKGAYIQGKLDPENIMYNCFDCHQKWDQGDPSGLPGYNEVVQKKQELKEKYNRGVV